MAIAISVANKIATTTHAAPPPPIKKRMHTIGNIFVGCYHDPRHPSGHRYVQMYDNIHENYSRIGVCDGSDVDAKNQVWSIPVEAWGDEKGVEYIWMDFRPKGVSKQEVGKWDPDEHGIAWDDGNLWSMVDNSNCPLGNESRAIGDIFVGCYQDPNHLNGYRRVTMSDSYYEDFRIGQCEGNDDDITTAAWTLPAEAWRTAEGDRIWMDFAPKGNDVKLNGIWDPVKFGIAWEDGNFWMMVDCASSEKEFGNRISDMS
eukprot:CAMPEP_0172502330 /NCGR_PEP_ID=MMETSP1066-20121228/158858_1 /TAXON_ID=671091 /ORGANISM="Coscinodiscus wailesii, Strain CCMP2513" /LENGTH=257 /DNA_ID=CAMNT_0013277543 /DNA_START=81 /DNA_END=854 /DNA_ORIENTATION=-